MNAKKDNVTAIVKLQVPAQKANPAPPIGPALGQHGVQIMDFCKQFNDRTKDQEAGLILPVVLHVHADRSFTFVITSPPAAVLLKKAAGIAKGSSVPNKDKVATLTMAQIEEIAKIKMPDSTGKSLEAVVHSIIGTAKSMGIVVQE